jgi:fructose-1,6-bisphosphatase/inositol monophosphatase family enzyme
MKTPPALPPIEAVDAIIRDVAAGEIMPRFRALADHEITEKNPGDIVTSADFEAEARLTEALGLLVPGSAVVGEEAAEDDPGILRALGGEAPVWLVDPLDGTRNFAEGRECFAVIVAYCRGGETLAGWIHDPIADVTIWAAAGEGAWMAGERLAAARPVPIAGMRGSLGRKFRKRFEKSRTGDVPASMTRVGCVGREYMDLARGRLHFAQYAQRLKPWDHAAGVLLHREAGGFNGLTEGRGSYHPAPRIQYASLLLAPDKTAWDSLHAVLAGG